MVYPLFYDVELSILALIPIILSPDAHLLLGGQGKCILSLLSVNCSSIAKN